MSADITIAAHFRTIQRVHDLVENLQAATTLGAYHRALEAAQALVETIKPIANSAADRNAG